MAKGISQGLIREAIQKLGGVTDDAARGLKGAVDDFADFARMTDNPRASFRQKVDDFGGIKYGDGFTMRRTSPYASDAPMFIGEQNFRRIKAHNGTEIIEPRKAATRSGERLLIGKNPDPIGIEMKETGFTMGEGSFSGTTRAEATYGQRGVQLPATKQVGSTAEDIGREAHINQDIEERIGKIDAQNAAERRESLKNEYLGRRGYDSEGNKKGFFQRRSDKKEYARQDRLKEASEYADAQLAGGLAQSGPGAFDGLPGWAKGAGLVTAGLIAGNVLSDD